MMDESLRRQYLEAMGVEMWALRSAEEPVVETPEPEVESPESQPEQQSPVAASVPPWQEEIPPPVEEYAPTAAPPQEPVTVTRADVAGLDWEGITAMVAECRSCALHETRTQSVFGVGDRQANLMVIGEAPGADEDRQGEPFVGRAGQLLNAMLQAIGLKREQVFIANILKCRPPNNRDPKPEEALQCEPFLLRQIELIQPKVILAVGRIAAQNLLHSTEAVGKLRNRQHRFGEQGIPVIVTYHPAYLLRSPDQKGKAWQDLKAALGILKGSEG
jgi:DNA polymerase